MLERMGRALFTRQRGGQNKQHGTQQKGSSKEVGSLARNGDKTFNRPSIRETRDRVAAVRLEYRNRTMLGRTHATLGCAAVTVARDQEAARSNRSASLVSVAVTSQWYAQEAAD